MIEIENTFAEAFPMKASRLIITALNINWAKKAALSFCGFATSVIACGCEAGIESELSHKETPDGRPGVSILIFSMSSNELKKSLMVEKFAALSLEKENFSLENLSLPKLEINSNNLSLLLEKNLVEKEKPALALCPGAEFGPSKRWPSEYYSEIAKTYIFHGWNVLCIGSKNDENIGIEIENTNNLSNEINFINLIGKTSLLDAIDILSYAKKVVTNDSGLMHIAAAVGTPLVALYGPSSPEYTPPLIDKKQILRKILMMCIAKLLNLLMMEKIS